MDHLNEYFNAFNDLKLGGNGTTQSENTSLFKEAAKKDKN
jgi:hypothetical protein